MSYSENICCGLILLRGLFGLLSCLGYLDCLGCLSCLVYGYCGCQGYLGNLNCCSELREVARLFGQPGLLWQSVLLSRTTWAIWAVWVTWAIGLPLRVHLECQAKWGFFRQLGLGCLNWSIWVVGYWVVWDAWAARAMATWATLGSQATGLSGHSEDQDCLAKELSGLPRLLGQPGLWAAWAAELLSCSWTTWLLGYWLLGLPGPIWLHALQLRVLLYLLDDWR